MWIIPWATACCSLAQYGFSAAEDTTARLKDYELHEAQQWQQHLARAEERAAEHYAQAPLMVGFLLDQIRLDKIGQDWTRLEKIG